ncbi:MAG: N-6 DNA methylase [Deltaproteobacteria bacterium]|nr:N-6 DNA methylase [Deltaproteobacteria bacterium]
MDRSFTDALSSLCLAHALARLGSLQAARALIQALAPNELLVSSRAITPTPLETQTKDSPHALGQQYQALLQRSLPSERKRRGSFYTPSALAQRVAVAALPHGTDARTVLDPACGAGALLLAACERVGPDALYGIDLDPHAIWVARVAIALQYSSHRKKTLLALCDRVRVGNGLDLVVSKPTQPSWPARFDAIVGNPPWVAFAGRAAVPLSRAQRTQLRERFRSWKGFPTLHGLFVEHAASLLAPHARMVFLLPLQVADLDGYQATRSALAQYAVVDEPVVSLGFGQFDGVVEPTLFLSAKSQAFVCASQSTGRPWVLADETPVSRRSPRRESLSPELLARLGALPRVAPETFGEGGFQSAGTLSKTHLGPWPSEHARFTVPMREGADVEPFVCHPPSIALDANPEDLRTQRARVRDLSFYHSVAVIVRQTARYPIAAVHLAPCVFRNSLLACFTPEPWTLCAVLNSSLVRALHLSTQRDGQQAVFPQLKVKHLRALPALPLSLAERETLADLAKRATRAQQARLDLVCAYGPAPKNLFRPQGDQVLEHSKYPAKLRSEEARMRYRDTLAQVRARWSEVRTCQRAIDAVIAKACGLGDADLACIERILTV